MSNQLFPEKLSSSVDMDELRQISDLQFYHETTMERLDLFRESNYPSLPSETSTGRDDPTLVSSESADEPETTLKLTSLVDRTNALVRGLDLILEHHEIDGQVRRALSIQVHNYLDRCFECAGECVKDSCLAGPKQELTWMKRAKYVLNYPLANYLNNVLPSPPPGGPFCPTGMLRRWMKSRLIAFNRRNTHLWYSWFQAKRSCMAVSEFLVDQAYGDHLKSLTSDDQGDPHVYREILEQKIFLSVLDSVRSEVTKNFQTDFTRGRTSTSASFEATRNEGGQHQTLRVISGLPDYPSFDGELCRMTYTPRRGVRQEMDSFGHSLWMSLRRSSHDFPDRVLNCTIQAVLEPLKIRIISKGESVPYYSMRSLQKSMHSAMRRMDSFRLIGRPLCPTDLIDLKEKADPTDEWFSVDYSAATDGVSWEYTSRILKYLIQDLPESAQLRALRVLGPHNLFYPKKGASGTIKSLGSKGPRTSKVVQLGVQKTGQLMGSILSFPILCLANLGLYLYNTRFHQADWTSKERLRHVLVNGDDMVYAAPPDLWEDHILYGQKVGLNMSIGKSYHHPEYLNVNSTSVHYDLRSDYSSPWKINFLNTGLFFGQHKVMGSSDDGLTISGECLSFAEDGSVDIKLPPIQEYALAHYGSDPRNGLCENLNTTLSGSLPGRACKLLRRFLSEHREAIDVETLTRYGGSLRHRNLFLPKRYGGMGVVPPPNWRFSFSDFDRMLVHRIQESELHDNCLPSRGPLATDDVHQSVWSKWQFEVDEPFIWPIKGKWTKKRMTTLFYPSGFYALDRIVLEEPLQPDPIKPLYHYEDLSPALTVHHGLPLSSTTTELSWVIEEFVHVTDL